MSKKGIANPSEKMPKRKAPCHTVAVEEASLGFCMSLALAPLMNPKYAGTSGRVQGARKVRMPAMNAGTMRDVASIMG